MWKFDQKEYVAAITTKQVIENHFPILVAIHYSEDHSWAFLCGTTSAAEDGRVISMKEAIAIDPTLEQIADLKPGCSARRKDISSHWIIDDVERY